MAILEQRHGVGRVRTGTGIQPIDALLGGAYNHVTDPKIASGDTVRHGVSLGELASFRGTEIPCKTVRGTVKFTDIEHSPDDNPSLRLGGNFKVGRLPLRAPLSATLSTNSEGRLAVATSLDVLTVPDVDRRARAFLETYIPAEVVGIEVTRSPKEVLVVEFVKR